MVRIVAGLFLIAVGTGIFKVNQSVLVGNLYAGKPQLKDAGFNIFYMGVNIGAAVDFSHRLHDSAIEEKVEFLFPGAGLPIKGIPVRAIRESGAKVAPIVSSARCALRASQVFHDRSIWVWWRIGKRLRMTLPKRRPASTRGVRLSICTRAASGSATCR